MIQFLASDLRPVLVEARAHACRVILVKDHGAYMMSEKSDGPRNGQPPVLAYAVGCDPDTDPFGECYDRARAEFGGNDFAEFFDHNAVVFDRVINDGWNLEVRADASHLYVDAVKPDA
jgi:hypothetical protein